MDKKLSKIVKRPGAGWKRIAGAVFDHDSGVRLHVLGLCKLPNGRLVTDGDYDQYLLQQKLIKINGGNRRRGMMAWALTVMANRHG